MVSSPIAPYLRQFFCRTTAQTVHIFTHEFTIFLMYKSLVNSLTHVKICVRKIYAQKLAYEL